MSRALDRLQQIPTSCNPIDRLLRGGFPTGVVSLAYGEAETGKSTLALQTAVNCVKLGYKAFFVDCDQTFSPKRVAEVAGGEPGDLSNLIVFSPKTFGEQNALIDDLEKYLTSRVKLVVFDSITTLYRVEVEKAPKSFLLHRELNARLALLAEYAKSHELAVLLTSQVREKLSDEGRGVVEPVASRALIYWSSVVLKLVKTPRREVRRIYLEKWGGSGVEGVFCEVKLGERGFEEAK